MTERVASDEKLKELILFICQRSLGDPQFGATKLDRLLFLADFAAFGKLKQAITWQEYCRLESGPAPRRMSVVLRELEDAGDLARARHDHFGRQQIRHVALRDANYSLFTVDEIAIVTELIHQFLGKSTAETDLTSHPLGRWRLAREDETIPYGIALLSLAEETSADRRIDDDLRAKLLTLQESA